MKGMVPMYQKQVATRWPAVVVVTVPKELSREQSERIKDILRKSFGRKQKIVVLSGGVNLDVVRTR